MKKILQSITMIMALSFMLSGTSFAQELQLTRPASTGEVPEYTTRDGGFWIEYWQGLGEVNENALGLGGEATTAWNAAIRWMPDDLGDFEDWAVSKIRVYINDEPEFGSVKIWQGDIDNPTEMVSQVMMVGEETWVEVELFDPYYIDITQELWIGWEMGDLGDGNFPAAFTVSDEFSPLSDLLQFGDNPWQPASNFGFDVVWNIEAYVIYMGDDDDDDDDNGDDPDMYNVTFNVDMTGVEGFDPNEHHVFMTGTFTDWAEPGSDESVQMELADVPAKDAPPFNFYENFDGYADFTTDLSPWITIQLTEGNTWGVSDFSFPGEGTEFAWMAFNPAETDPPIDETDGAVDGSKYAVAIQYTDFDDDKWLISPEFSINETSELSFWARSYTHAYGAERIRVLVSTTGADPGNFIPISPEPYMEVPIEWTQYSYDLSDYAGEEIRFAINYVSNDAFIFMLDAILLTAEEDDDNGDDPDQLIYTATVEVPAGMAEYKYFSDAFGAGWEGGEWAGDPNREIEVTADMEVHDVWGDPPNTIVEVPESIFSVYPNPASSVLNINANGEIKNVVIYDITGRVVLQQTEDVVNVSSFRNGLYIIQVNTTEGVESHRFHVVK